MILGVAASVPVGGILAGQLLYLNSRDTWAHLAAVLVFLATGGLAALVPALRALRSDPLRALRHE